MSWARLAAGCLLALIATDAALASGALQQSFLQPMGPVAQEQASHLMRVVGITMIVILPVLVGVPLILWRYRYAKPRGAYAPEWEFSGKLEYALWGVPVLIVIVLASWLWYSTHKLDPYEPLGPDPLQVQVPIIRDVLAAYGIKVVGAPEAEADDVIGTLATGAGQPVDIVTGDRDLFQLIDDARDVRVVYTARGMSNLETVTDDVVVAKYGVRAAQYADFSTMRGDASAADDTDDITRCPHVPLQCVPPHVF